MTIPTSWKSSVTPISTEMSAPKKKKAMQAATSFFHGLAGAEEVTAELIALPGRADLYGKRSWFGSPAFVLPEDFSSLIQTCTQTITEFPVGEFPLIWREPDTSKV